MDFVAVTPWTIRVRPDVFRVISLLPVGPCFMNSVLSLSPAYADLSGITCVGYKVLIIHR